MLRESFYSFQFKLGHWLWFLLRKLSGSLTREVTLALVILTLVISACGEGNRATPSPGVMNLDERVTPRVTASPSLARTPTSMPTPTLEVDVAELKGVVVEFWYVASGALEREIEATLEDFNRQNMWGITVQGLAYSDFDHIYEALQSALEGYKFPNVVTAYLYQALAWDASGELGVDLKPYITDAVWGLPEDEQADYFPVYWSHAQRGSGIPFLGSARVLYYNRTWAKELGFSATPLNPEQFKQQACAAASANRQDQDARNDGKGGLILPLDYSAALGWINSFGGEVVAPDHEGYRFNTPEVKGAFSFLRDLYDEGCAWLSDSHIPEAEFAARRGLFVAGSPLGISYQEEAFVDASSGDEWTVIPFPSPTGKPVVEAYGPALFVLRASPEKQLASWLLVRWMTSPEVQGHLARVSGYLPVRSSALKYASPLPEVHPQWKEGLDLLRYAHPEPDYKSWRVVRWAVSDAATQLFRYYFQADQIPDLVRLLDETANDLHRQDQ